MIPTASELQSFNQLPFSIFFFLPSSLFYKEEGGGGGREDRSVSPTSVDCSFFLLIEMCC